MSEYLRTEGMDILPAHRMVGTAPECLWSMSRYFVSIRQQHIDLFRIKKWNWKWKPHCHQKGERKILERWLVLRMSQVQGGILRSLCIILSGTQPLSQYTDDSWVTLYSVLGPLDPWTFSQVRSSLLPQSAFQELSLEKRNYREFVLWIKQVHSTVGKNINVTITRVGDQKSGGWEWRGG